MRKKIKILQLINTLSAGGAELQLLTLCRQLKKKGAEITVAFMRERIHDSRSLLKDFQKEGCRVFPLSSGNRYDLRPLWKIPFVIQKEKPDVLHTHLPRADFVGAVGKILFPALPWVCSIHDIYESSWSGKWTLPFFDLVWRCPDALISSSHAVKYWLIRNRHIHLDKVHVVHYGIDAYLFRKKEVSNDAWDTNGKCLIGSIGRLEPRKGHQILIEAMPMILEKYPDAVLLIAGHDPWDYGKELRCMIQKRNLKENVRLVGFQKDIAAFLHSIQVFAFASLSEGFGQAVIEAMAAGKPVVASRIDPLTEIIQEGRTGLFVKADDPRVFAEKIIWLLANAEEGKKMGMEGLKRVENEFNWEKMGNRVMEIYENVLKVCHERR